MSYKVVVGQFELDPLPIKYRDAGEPKKRPGEGFRLTGPHEGRSENSLAVTAAAVPAATTTAAD
jgi:hypothetical protein